MSENITIFTLDDVTTSTDRSWGRGESPKYKRAEVPVPVLTEQVSNFLAAVSQILSHAEAKVTGFKLTEVTVTAEISAKGAVSILGCGGEVAGKGGLAFKFVR